MMLMERKILFRECGKHKLYFGMYLDDSDTVYEGYCIDDNELDGDYTLYNLIEVWNSLTGDNLDASSCIDKPFFNDMIIEFISSKYKIDRVEGFSWKEIGTLCLKKLDEVNLLGDIGRKLLKHKDLFPITLNNLSEWLERQELIYETMATSSLVGGDDEKAIEEWIAKEEKHKMKELLCPTNNKYLVVIANDYIRDVQIAPNEKIHDVFNDVGETKKDYEWIDTNDGDLAIGIYKGYNLEEALNDAAIVWNIDKRALSGYELK